MDVKEIEEFLKSLQMSIPKLKKAFDWELEFFIERAKELKIKGMVEFLKEKTGRDFEGIKDPTIRRGRPPKSLRKQASGKKADKPNNAPIVAKEAIETSGVNEEEVTILKSASTNDDIPASENPVGIKLIERLNSHRVVGSTIRELLTMDKYISKSAVTELEKELYNTTLIEHYLEDVVREIIGRDV